MRRRVKRHREDRARWRSSSRAAREAFERAPESQRRKIAKVAGWKDGKQAFGKFRAFTGVPIPPSIKMLDAPGKQVVVGMGQTNKVVYHNKGKRVRRGKWFGVFNASGRRILLVNRKRRAAIPKNPQLNPIGRILETHYIMPRDVELAGTPKRGTYWIHKHRSQGGKPPQGYEDQNGNIWYAPGTYRIHRWLRR